MKMKTNISKKINVLYLDHTAKWSGGEIALFRSLTAIDKNIINPHVLLDEEGEFANKMRYIGVKTEIFPLSHKVISLRKDKLDKHFFSNVSSFTEYIKYAILLSKRIQEEKTGLVHCNSLKSDIYGGIASRISKIPVIWHIRDHISYPYLPKKIVSMFKKMVKYLPSGIISNSRSTLNCLIDDNTTKKRFCVIYDGMTNEELSSPPRNSFESWGGIPKIGILGRIVEWKGQHIFLSAANILLNRGIVAEYQVIGASLFGEDEYQSKIYKQAEKLDSRIKFLGFRLDVSKILRNLDILVHCSTLPEPFGQVIIEGMAEGLPVLATNAGGVKEIIKHGVDGILSPIGDDTA